MPTPVNSFIKKLIKSPWTFRQPLTFTPKENGTAVSDLFVWIHNEEFEVFFELLNLNYLSGSEEQSQVEIVFFDKSGDVLFVKCIALLNGYRQRLNITEILQQNCNSFISGYYGTFAIFHLHSPKIVSAMNSFVAERGYVSYRYKKSPIASYVHGNYDAIGKFGSGYIPLGGESFLKRSYDLQYHFATKEKYQIFLTNPCKKIKNISVKIISLIDRKKIRELIFEINSKSALFFDLDDAVEPFRISIESRMVMARPIIFRFEENSMDVFHG